MKLVGLPGADHLGRHRGGDAGADRERWTAQGRRWSTVGVSANIVDASFQALQDAIVWKLMRDGAPVAGTVPPGLVGAA